MHPMNYVRRGLIWGLVLACLTTPTRVQAQPNPANERGNVIVVPVQGRVSLESRSKKFVRQSRWDEAIGNLNVQPDAANPRAVILTGIRPGVNRVTLVDQDNKEEVYEVIIQNDIELLRAILKRAVPTANVDVIPFGTSAILTGNVARAEDVNTILEVSGRILGSGPGGLVNAMSVGGVQQVQLDVTVARVDRTKSRSRGINFIVNGTTVSAGSVLGGLTSSTGASSTTAAATGVGIIPSAASAAPTSAANLVFGIIPAQFQGLLQALKTEGLAKLLAEPKLVTQSGRPARMLSGGRQATLSAGSGINGPGVVYEEIGTELEFLPIVYGNGKIYLEVAPRVRGVNQGLGITTSFGTVPGFDEQSVRTSVVMESGQTFAIGGLIQTNVQSSVSKVPVIGEIPFFGALFNVINQTEQEQELVILVTPHLVDAMDCNQVPSRLPGRETRAPDDFEFFLESMMELPRGQRNVFEGRRYKGPWKNDPTAAQFPCGGYGANYGTGNCATGQCAPKTVTTPGTIGASPQSPTQLPSSLNPTADMTRGTATVETSDPLPMTLPQSNGSRTPRGE